MKIGKITMKDYLKAVKIGNREADKEIGFVRKNKVHKSKKTYSRKNYKIPKE
jgi:hypothetical protein